MTIVRPFLIALLLLFPLLVTAQKKPAPRKSPYINYTYKGTVPSSTLPNGVKHWGGSLIGDFNSDPVYSISQVSKGKTKMLWLEESTGQDHTGVTGWRVLDVLDFPTIAPADDIFVSPEPSVACRRNGSEIPDTVGFGRVIRRQGIFRPAKLWVVNLKTKRFEPISLTGIECEYAEP